MNQDNFNGKNAENQGIIAMTAQKRIAEAVKFFDFLYDRVPTPTFIYLAKFKDKREFPAFSATDAKQRQAMAVKAVELSDSSVDIWHSVNPVSVKPSGGKRGDESAVAYQVAIVTDIDIRSDAHKSENLAADFDEAKSFLPFAPTILIHSGYGIQAYYVFETPIKISDENREECKRRNELFLDVIRARANGKTIDAVGDLPRILRTPGTFNYKLEKDNAPLCHIVDFSDVRFTPAEIDEKLAALPIPATPSKPVDVDKSARNHREIIDDSDFDIYRARRMLDFINPASLSYEDWFAVGAALKNVGCSCSDWQIWSKADDRFKDGECEQKWQGFNRDGYGIGTLYNFAAPNGYDAKEIYREYADLHPDFARKRADRANVFDKFNTDRLQSVRKTTTNDAEPIGISDSTSPKAKRQERADRMNDLMTTREVADFLDVSPKTVASWRTRKLFGVPFFSADEKHGNTWYYKRERVEQLKSVYQFGILQNMYKLARRNPESYAPSFFSENCYSNMTSTLGARKIKLDGVIEVDEDEYQKLAEAEDENYARRYFKYYKDYFSVDEVANYFGVQENTVIQWNKRGQLKWDMLDHDGEMFFKAEKIFEFTPPKERKTKPDRADERPVDTENFIGTKKKISSCPIDLKIPKCFVFSARGISFCVKGKADKETGEQEFKYLPVANTALVPTKIFYNPEKKTDEYEIGIFSRDTWRFAEVDARTLGDTKKLNTLCDYGALIDDYARLRSYFNAIIANNDIPVIKAYDKTGWTDFDCTEFIYPHENAPYLLRRSGFSFADVFKPKGNAEEWLLKFAEIIEMAGAPALVVIGLELAAPLVRPLGLPNLQAHLYGTSGIGKTALPRFGASVFGNPNNGGLSRTFSATYKNLLETSAAYCDLPIVLEEKETLNSKKEEDLQQAIYDYEQGVCNQAQKRDGTSREIKRFYGTRISTGEHPLLKDNSKDGANKRYLPLKVTKLFDDETAKDIHRFYNHNHGLFGLQWVRYIPAHMDDIRKDFAEVYALIEQQEKKINPTHATTLAAALAAVYNFKKCVDLYSEDFEAAEQNEILAAVKWTVDQLPAADAQIDYKRAIDDLSSFYNSHEKYFSRDIESPTDSDKTEFISARAPESYGHCFIDGEIAFYRTSLIKILEKELGYASGKKLIDDFCTHGFLKHNQGRLTYQTYIHDEKKRVILLKANVLNDIEDDE